MLGSSARARRLQPNHEPAARHQEATHSGGRMKQYGPGRNRHGCTPCTCKRGGSGWGGACSSALPPLLAQEQSTQSPIAHICFSSNFSDLCSIFVMGWPHWPTSPSTPPLGENTIARRRHRSTADRGAVARGGGRAAAGRAGRAGMLRGLILEPRGAFLSAERSQRGESRRQFAHGLCCSPLHSAVPEGSRSRVFGEE